MSNIIPFGKYKGQPLEAIAEDRDYLDWLTAQRWFRDRYPQIYTVVINNFQEPSNTPEHNRLHVRFLDDDFCLDVCSKITELVEPAVEWKKFEHEGYDVALCINSVFCSGDYACDLSGHVCSPMEIPPCDEGIKRSQYRWGGGEGVRAWDEHAGLCSQCTASRRYETYKCGDSGWFKKLGGCRCSCHQPESHKHCQPCKGTNGHQCHAGSDERANNYFGIEIKPTVSDDFPSILRSIKRLDDIHYRDPYKVLCLHEYTGQGATQEQFIAFMESEGIKVVWI